MPGFFDKKNDTVTSDAAELLAQFTKPRFDFIDQEYKKMEPLINRVTESIEECKAIKEVMFLKLRLAPRCKDLLDLYIAVREFRIKVLKIDPDQNDALSRHLISCQGALKQIFEYIKPKVGDTQSDNGSEIYPQLELIENIDRTLREAIVTAKEKHNSKWASEYIGKKNPSFCAIL